MDNLQPLGHTLRRPSSAPATEPSLVVRCRGAAVELPDWRPKRMEAHLCEYQEDVAHCSGGWCSVDLFRGSRRRSSSFAARADIPGYPCTDIRERPPAKYPDTISWTDSSLAEAFSRSQPNPRQPQPRYTGHKERSSYYTCKTRLLVHISPCGTRLHESVCHRQMVVGSRD